MVVVSRRSLICLINKLGSRKKISFHYFSFLFHKLKVRFRERNRRTKLLTSDYLMEDSGESNNDGKKRAGKEKSDREFLICLLLIPRCIVPSVVLCKPWTALLSSPEAATSEPLSSAWNQATISSSPPRFWIPFQIDSILINCAA